MKNQAFPPKNPRKSADLRQSGNILFLIFIAVALFGALSFAMMKGNRANTGLFTGEQAKLAASEIIGYGTLMRDAAKVLKINGCTENQITFEGSHTAAYVNAAAPANFSCHFFRSQGAGMNYKIPEGPFTQQYTPTIGFDANHCVDTIGTGSGSCTTGGAELIMHVFPLTKDVCVAINNALNIGGPNLDPPTNTASPANNASNFPFDGAYGPGALSLITGGGTLTGKPAACFQSTAGYTNGFYIFYQVLLAR